MKEGPTQDAARTIERAQHVLVFTGAGVSAESGVPTFRGPDGLWNNHRPEELATPEAFARDPRLVWEWYGWRRTLVSGCRPNAAHAAIATLAVAREGAAVVTQNVDGLHAVARDEAESSEARARRSMDGAGRLDGPLELHGSLFRVRCTACGDRAPHRGPIDAADHASLPACGACGGLLRPDVVWFGESLDESVLDRAFEEADRADVCLTVGTSALVQPAASLPLATKRSGGCIIEVNPRETPLTPLADYSLRGAAAEIVPRILPRH